MTNGKALRRAQDRPFEGLRVCDLIRGTGVPPVFSGRKPQPGRPCHEKLTGSGQALRRALGQAGGVRRSSEVGWETAMPNKTARLAVGQRLPARQRRQGFETGQGRSSLKVRCLVPHGLRLVHDRPGAIFGSWEAAAHHSIRLGMDADMGGPSGSGLKRCAGQLLRRRRRRQGGSSTDASRAMVPSRWLGITHQRCRMRRQRMSCERVVGRDRVVVAPPHFQKARLPAAVHVVQ